MQQLSRQIQIKVYASLVELDESDRELLTEARKAAHRAYAPYSGFQVGAAVLLEDGEIMTGNNQENMAYPSGLCAERVAIFAASAAFPGKVIKKIAISARSDDFKVDGPVTPCGACRQVMAEYESLQNQSIKVLMGSEKDEVWEIDNVADLIPFVFRAEGLKRKP